MKRAQRTDLVREMKKSFNRYISILLIMALGVAFYAGVRSAEPDMQLSAKDFFDSTDYMDIRVLGTLGMTEEDVTAIGGIGGIAVAEGGYQTELFLASGHKDYQMNVYSMGDAVTRVYVTEGRIPQAPDECFMDEDFLRNAGYHIGDVITLKAEEDTELSDVLHQDTFTIVGYGSYPNYLSWNRGSVSIGTGVEDGFLFVTKDAFSMEVYTVVYATVEGAKNLNPYQDDYKELVAKVAERVEAIAGTRCEIRYEEITKPYWDDVAEAEKEIADAEAEIADGEKELADAEAELADAEKEIADGEKELADGEKKLADGKIDWENGQEEYYKAEGRLNAARLDLEDALALITAGEQELVKAKDEITAAELQIANGEKELKETKTQLSVARLELDGAKPYMPEQEYIARNIALNEAVQKAQNAEDELNAAKAALETAKTEFVLGEQEITEARKQYREGKEEYEAGVAELAQAKLDLEAGKEELATAEADLIQGKAELEDAKIKLADGKKEVEDGKQELADAKVKLADGKAELADAKKELSDIAVPEWYVLDRETVQQVVEYGMDSERIGKLGDVFPAVFYLVAALVSLTTMTRMIEEERTQIGTMKALGYEKGAIVSKYMWYSLSATLLGGGIGVIVGSYFFPWVIITAYGILYSHIPNVITPVQWELSLMSVLLAVVCTVVATLSSCYKELAATPAILMRPVAPTAGKRVFLERIKFLWNSMNFSWKATCRNLFRYKKRFFMTIFGIGGCMALLLVGFGLQDSVMEVVNNQFRKIWTYDAYLAINDETMDIESKDGFSKVENYMLIESKNLDAESDAAVKSVTLFVPETLDGLEEFLKLQDRVTGEKYTLTEEGVVLSEKLAKMLEVSVGEEVELYIDDMTKRPVKITAIAENYMSHYIYMCATQYREVFDKAPEYNQMYLKFGNLKAEEEGEFSREMLQDDAVDSVIFVHELEETVTVMMQALNLVVVVLIVAAGMLAFIVLYNLNNINIIERRRELATLKVLGFYDGEVAAYVYRENILLTVLGIVAGVIMGIFLHRFVILTVEVDLIMFGRNIEAPSFLYSILLTGLFSVLINGGMFFKLAKIDMVESLKSAE